MDLTRFDRANESTDVFAKPGDMITIDSTLFHVEKSCQARLGTCVSSQSWDWCDDDAMWLAHLVAIAIW